MDTILFSWKSIIIFVFEFKNLEKLQFRKSEGKHNESIFLKYK